MRGIYKIINILNEKVYIGSTSRDLNLRWVEHKSKLRELKHHSRHLQSAWNKDGEDNFIFEILEEIIDFSRDFLERREQYYIDLYKSYDPKFGYNVCPKAHSCAGRKLSDIHKKRLSESQKGEKNHNFGKHHSPEHKKRISDMLIGKRKHPLSEEAKQKIRNARAKQIITEEHKKNISKALSGEKNYFYGKHRSPESKEKNRIAHAKLTWSQVREIREKYKSGNYYQKELAKEYDITLSAIKAIIQNRTWKE